MTDSKVPEEKAAAPGEESWDNLRDKYLDDNFARHKDALIAKETEDGYQLIRNLVMHGFDAAIELVAKPLQWQLWVKGGYEQDFKEELERRVRIEKERDEARAECMEQARLLGMGAERELKLKATEAALREKNERLQKACAERCESQQKLADDVRTVAKERDALRQQLADCIEGFEGAFGPAFWESPLGKKLKAPAMPGRENEPV